MKILRYLKQRRNRNKKIIYSIVNEKKMKKEYRGHCQWVSGSHTQKTAFSVETETESHLHQFFVLDV